MTNEKQKMSHKIFISIYTHLIYGTREREREKLWDFGDNLSQMAVKRKTFCLAFFLLSLFLRPLRRIWFFQLLLLHYAAIWQFFFLCLCFLFHSIAFVFCILFLAFLTFSHKDAQASVYKINTAITFYCLFGFLFIDEE